MFQDIGSAMKHTLLASEDMTPAQGIGIENWMDSGILTYDMNWDGILSLSFFSQQNVEVNWSSTTVCGMLQFHFNSTALCAAA